ncbi:MAG: polymer-forming cytoskeletal protein [Hyphomicrobiaceae bacterium]
MRGGGAPEPASVTPLPPRAPSGVGAPSQFGAPPGAKRVSVIGSDLAILGADLRIVSRGTVQIEGVVQGDVLGAEVIIGDEGSVTGLVNAEKVTIHGTVLGTIRALEVKLAATAKVEGDIHHHGLALEHGAQFEGAARRPKEKSALVPDLDGAGAQPKADGVGVPTPSVPPEAGATG